MISLVKWKIAQKCIGDLGKIIVAPGFEKLPIV